MKKILLILLTTITATAAYSQDDAIGRFFSKYVEDSRFTVVSVSPRMFRLMSKVNWDTIPQDLRQAVSRLQSFRVLSTETTPDRFFKEAMAQIDRKVYEDLITV